MINNYFSTYLF